MVRCRGVMWPKCSFYLLISPLKIIFIHVSTNHQIHQLKVWIYPHENNIGVFIFMYLWFIFIFFSSSHLTGCVHGCTLEAFFNHMCNDWWTLTSLMFEVRPTSQRIGGFYVNSRPLTIQTWLWKMETERGELDSKFSNFTCCAIKCLSAP